MAPDDSKTQPARFMHSSPNSIAWGLFCGGILLTMILLTINVSLISDQLGSDHFSLGAERDRATAFWQLCNKRTTPTKRTELFLSLVAEGNEEWRSAILKGLSLDRTDLSEAKLKFAVFSECSMKRTDFHGSMLDGAGLDNSDLSGAVFSSAHIQNATFFKSELKGADFRNADLASTSFEQSRALGASFVSALMGDAFLAMADLTDSDLTNADLSGANLEAAILRNTDLALANLYGAKLTDTDFTDSNWWRTKGLSSTTLDDLTLEYPPTANASKSRQRDFEIWLRKRLQDAEEQARSPADE